MAAEPIAQSSPLRMLRELSAHGKIGSIDADATGVDTAVSWRNYDAADAGIACTVRLRAAGNPVVYRWTDTVPRKVELRRKTTSEDNGRIHYDMLKTSWRAAVLVLHESASTAEATHLTISLPHVLTPTSDTFDRAIGSLQLRHAASAAEVKTFLWRALEKALFSVAVSECPANLDL